jgi:hypothetical protein
LDPDYDTDDSEKEGENEVPVIENLFFFVTDGPEK